MAQAVVNRISQMSEEELDALTLDEILALEEQVMAGQGSGDSGEEFGMSSEDLDMLERELSKLIEEEEEMQRKEWEERQAALDRWKAELKLISYEANHSKETLSLLVRKSEEVVWSARMAASTNVGSTFKMKIVDGNDCRLVPFGEVSLELYKPKKKSTDATELYGTAVLDLRRVQPMKIQTVKMEGMDMLKRKVVKGIFYCQVLQVFEAHIPDDMEILGGPGAFSEIKASDQSPEDVCVECNRKITGDYFSARDSATGRVHEACMDAHVAKFAVLCLVCNQAITGKYFSVGEGKVHGGDADCYEKYQQQESEVCVFCAQHIVNSPFYAYDEGPVHVECSDAYLEQCQANNRVIRRPTYPAPAIPGRGPASSSAGASPAAAASTEPGKDQDSLWFAVRKSGGEAEKPWRSMHLNISGKKACVYEQGRTKEEFDFALIISVSYTRRSPNTFKIQCRISEDSQASSSQEFECRCKKTAQEVYYILDCFVKGYASVKAFRTDPFSEPNFGSASVNLSTNCGTEQVQLTVYRWKVLVFQGFVHPINVYAVVPRSIRRDSPTCLSFKSMPNDEEITLESDSEAMSVELEAMLTKATAIEELPDTTVDESERSDLAEVDSTVSIICRIADSPIERGWSTVVAMGDLTVISKVAEAANLYSIRIDNMHVEAPMVAVCQALWHVEARKRWDKTVSKAQLVSVPDDDHRVLHLLESASALDMLFDSTTYQSRTFLENGGALITYKSTVKPYVKDFFPKAWGVTRKDVRPTGYLVSPDPSNDGACFVTYVECGALSMASSQHRHLLRSTGMLLACRLAAQQLSSLRTFVCKR